MSEKQAGREDGDNVVMREKIAVVGMGYVGLPLAISFAKYYDVTGFDVDHERIRSYMEGTDPTEMVGSEGVRNSDVSFTGAEEDIQGMDYYVITVPTPITPDKRPDMEPLRQASEAVGRQMKKGSVVIYESTVYPGATEDYCVPLLEQASGLQQGEGFTVGYSPERINPGDTHHQVRNVVKIVSGSDEKTADRIAALYGKVVEAGIYRARSIRVAEAAKLAENSQRDLNIAFVNELAMVFDRMGISTGEVIDAMNTKWNALGFRPGLVGGHCIGVDPYYFVHQAEKFGYRDSLVLFGRKINDSMGRFVAEHIIRELSRKGFAPARSRIIIFGVTFKENCRDLRNTGVLDIVETLREFGAEPVLTDPVADEEEVKNLFGCPLSRAMDPGYADCVVMAVAHDQYREMAEEEILAAFGDRSPEDCILIDIRGVLNSRSLISRGYTCWSLT